MAEWKATLDDVTTSAVVCAAAAAGAHPRIADRGSGRRPRRPRAARGRAGDSRRSRTPRARFPSGPMASFTGDARTRASWPSWRAAATGAHAARTRFRCHRRDSRCFSSDSRRCRSGSP